MVGHSRHVETRVEEGRMDGGSRTECMKGSSGTLAAKPALDRDQWMDGWMEAGQVHACVERVEEETHGRMSG